MTVSEYVYCRIMEEDKFLERIFIPVKYRRDLSRSPEVLRDSRIANSSCVERRCPLRVDVMAGEDCHPVNHDDDEVDGRDISSSDDDDDDDDRNDTFAQRSTRSRVHFREASGSEARPSSSSSSLSSLTQGDFDAPPCRDSSETDDVADRYRTKLTKGAWLVLFMFCCEEVTKDRWWNLISMHTSVSDLPFFQRKYIILILFSKNLKCTNHWFQCYLLAVMKKVFTRLNISYGTIDGFTRLNLGDTGTRLTPTGESSNLHLKLCNFLEWRNRLKFTAACPRGVIYLDFGFFSSQDTIFHFSSNLFLHLTIIVLSWYF